MWLNHFECFFSFLEQFKKEYTVIWLVINDHDKTILKEIFCKLYRNSRKTFNEIPETKILAKYYKIIDYVGADLIERIFILKRN